MAAMTSADRPGLSPARESLAADGTGRRCGDPLSRSHFALRLRAIIPRDFTPGRVAPCKARDMLRAPYNETEAFPAACALRWPGWAGANGRKGARDSMPRTGNSRGKLWVALFRLRISRSFQHDGG